MSVMTSAVPPAVDESNGISVAKRNTILIVEDEAMVRALTSAVLKRAGYAVLEAEDGVEGAAIFAKNFEKIDLLLTDISLPGLRGPDLARYARQLQPTVQILFMSGSIQFEEKSVADEIYRSGCLEKPFTAEQLRDQITARLGRVFKISF